MLGMFCPGILIAIAECAPSGSRWPRWFLDLSARRWALPLAAGCLAAAGAISVGVLPAGRIPDLGYYLVATLARPLFAVGYGIVLVRAIRARPWGGRLGPALAEFGLVSYGIYLIHAVIVHALLDTTWGRGLIPLRNGDALAFVVHAAYLLAITLPLAWLSWRYLERPILEAAIRFGSDRQRRRATERATASVAEAAPSSPAAARLGWSSRPNLETSDHPTQERSRAAP